MTRTGVAHPLCLYYGCVHIGAVQSLFPQAILERSRLIIWRDPKPKEIPVKNNWVQDRDAL